MDEILQLTNLSKNYGHIKAVDDLSLTVKRGEVFGLLGPNGSGKTTTLGIILGVLFQTSGQYKWFGESPTATQRKKLGAVLEMPNFYPYLGGTNNLKIIAQIKGVDYSDINRVLRVTGLEKRGYDRFKTYSYGMKQRLAIAAALLGNPRVLILDEPTNGLDPQGIAEIRELIQRIASEGITIILASHLLDEVQKICSHVAVLKTGKLLFCDRVDELVNSTGLVVVQASNMPQLRAALVAHDQIEAITQENDHYVVSFKNNVIPWQLNTYLFEKGIALNHLSIRKKTLETHFLELLRNDQTKQEGVSK
jgi:ABC-2 type transport system ATP-binding protein